MIKYNKKIGNYIHYYNTTLNNYIKNYNYFHNYLHSDSLSYCLLSYPILYKKIYFFKFSCTILKKRKRKNVFFFNQTILLEGYLSKRKLFVTLPIFSFLNKMSIFQKK